MGFAVSWEVKAKRQSLLSASLYLIAGDGRRFPIDKSPIDRPVGHLIAPGVESGRFTEAWAIRPPPSVPPGKYRGVLLIHDPLETSGVPERQTFKRMSFDVGEFDLK